LGKGKTHETYQDARLKVAKDSFCRTTIHGSLTNPELVHIELKGPVASIPALKNSKVQGMNVLREATRARLEVMSEIFQKSVNFQPPRYTVRIFCLILLSYRGRAFDEDNVLTTVRDWLEPRFIRRHDRKWGVGIIPNDRMVNGFPVPKLKGAPTSEVTEIIIRPEASILSARDIFIQEILRISV
jgi:hypothetical protein